ncbi:MAG TPA: hypothetical protein VE710_24005 [Candidatus Bathyarchaeia archaeon]|nr:hypothetical protein [Candidatus Bathyarchaeia archaeon]
MRNKSKFEKVISELGFNTDAPINSTSNINLETGKTNLAFIMQGDSDVLWNSDLGLAAIRHLIEVNDNQYSHAEPEIYEKYILQILDSIGSVIKWNAPYEGKNINVVKRFIEDSLMSNAFTEAEEEGLINKTDDTDDSFFD